MAGSRPGIRAAINARLEEVSFRTGMMAAAATLLVLGAATAAVVLTVTPSHGSPVNNAAGAPGRGEFRGRGRHGACGAVAPPVGHEVAGSEGPGVVHPGGRGRDDGRARVAGKPVVFLPGLEPAVGLCKRELRRRPGIRAGLSGRLLARAMERSGDAPLPGKPG